MIKLLQLGPRTPEGFINVDFCMMIEKFWVYILKTPCKTFLDKFIELNFTSILLK